MQWMCVCVYEERARAAQTQIIRLQRPTSRESHTKQTENIRVRLKKVALQIQKRQAVVV